MLPSFFYYIFYGSVVCLYGIGLERIIELSENDKHIILKTVKMLICVSSSSSLSYLFINVLLAPRDLAELYPFVVLLIFTLISVFIEAIIRIATKMNAAEFSVALLFIFIGITESATLTTCVINSCTCVIVFFMIISFLNLFTYRFYLNKNRDSIDGIFFLLIVISIVTLFILVWNVSWFNKGVFAW